jgi:hypothetical protein
LSNAYGISSGATQPTSNILRHFLPSQYNTNLTPTAFPSVATQHKIKYPPTIPLHDGIIARHKNTQGVALGYLVADPFGPPHGRGFIN